MSDTNQIRADAHEEIETIANKTASIDRIVTYTRNEAEDKLGLSWTNLANIYFTDDETIGTVHALKDTLDNKDYLVTVDEEDGETCLVVQMTHDLHKRLE